MSNLENFRKQAQQYLRWHRERYYPVAAIIREHLPRFRPLSDPEILAAVFRLADAQELVARKEGASRMAGAENKSFDRDVSDPGR